MGSEISLSTIPELTASNMDMFHCPACRGDLKVLDHRRMISCSSCQRPFESDSGIPLMFWPNEWTSNVDVTEIVKSFYEENPFPNYEDLDSDWSLREKAERGVFARLLDEQIPYGSKVLEVGCGTGQLSNFLGLKFGRTVFGVDICLNSLRLGNRFKQENEIDNVVFTQMNLFNPVFKPETFDLVICNGVLHHTSDPFLGFQSISTLVKEGGHIIIGLYNTFGRIPTNLKQFLFKVSGDRFKFIDSRLRDNSIGNKRRLIWFMDQYKHPHESKHTIGEVVRWFEVSGFEFVTSIPKPKAFDSFAPDEKLFSVGPKGTKLDNFVAQAGMLLRGGSEGGFFVMVGRKNSK